MYVNYCNNELQRNYVLDYIDRTNNMEVGGRQ